MALLKNPLQDFKLICGIEAASLIRKLYKIEKMFKEEPTWLMSFFLAKLTAYKSRTPDSTGKYIINQGITILPNNDTDCLLLFYDVKEIEALVSSEKLPFISMNKLQEREDWKDWPQHYIVSFLQGQSSQGKVRVFSFEHYFPGHYETKGTGSYKWNNGKLIEETYQEWVPTGHYGLDAQELIQTGKALLYLPDIEVLEEVLFEKEVIKEAVKCSPYDDVERSFNKQLKLIQDNSADVPKNKKIMAGRILKDLQAQGELTEKEKRSAINTILRKLSDLNYKGRIKALKS